MTRRRALFLDRDGVINVEHNYVHRIEDFRFIDGVFETCRAAHELGYLLFVVTNQGGIALGYYTEHDFDVLTEWMRQVLEREGVTFSEIYHCPYHPDGERGDYEHLATWRKPAPGMLLAAQEAYDLDIKESVMVGDKSSDIAAGIAAGVGTTIQVRTGWGRRDPHADADLRVDSVADVGSWLRQQSFAR